jgi:hypothetical protein
VIEPLRALWYRRRGRPEPTRECRIIERVPASARLESLALPVFNFAKAVTGCGQSHGVDTAEGVRFMHQRSVRSRPITRVAAGLWLLAVAAGGCSGVAPDVVRNSTSAISAQVALAKASLLFCRGGDREQCDSAHKNLEAIGASNAQLSVAADQ